MYLSQASARPSQTLTELTHVHSVVVEQGKIERTGWGLETDFSSLARKKGLDMYS